MSRSSRCSGKSHDGSRSAVRLSVASEVAELSDNVVQLLDVVGRRRLSHYTLQIEGCILALLIDLPRASEVSEQLRRSARRTRVGRDGRCTLSERARYVEASRLTARGAERAAGRGEKAKSEKRASGERARGKLQLRAEAVQQISLLKVPGASSFWHRRVSVLARRSRAFAGDAEAISAESCRPSKLRFAAAAPAVPASA